MRGLAIFFGCTTAILAAAVVWLIGPGLVTSARQDGPSDQSIAFPTKMFVGGKGWVAAKGTMTADWVGYKNNTYSILCFPEGCTVASVQQIGINQIGSIDGPITYPVKSWTDDGVVVSESDDPCVRVTITLDRQAEAVFWVETPINQTAMNCKNTGGNVRRATLEPSLFWRKSTDASLRVCPETSGRIAEFSEHEAD
jgi:hypothetical protein